jgi:hypothetical protein
VLIVAAHHFCDTSTCVRVFGTFAVFCGCS